MENRLSEMEQSFSIRGLWRYPWRVGGIAGIVFLILFFLGGFALQGDSPSRDDSIEDIRRYFAEDGDTYLAGDYILGLAFAVFFLIYLVTLRSLLATREASPQIWSRLALVGGVILVVVGGVAGLFWGALAIGAAANPEVDESAVRTLMELDTYAFGALLPLPMAVFLLGASLVIWDTGVLWRWLAGLGLLAAVLLLIGAAWPIDGDEEGTIAIFGFVGFPLSALFVLLSSINMLMLREPPETTEAAVSA